MNDSLRELFHQPPRHYSPVPFWFLNDELNEIELCRQIDDFEAHGIYGFIPHPRIGLPKNIQFVSEKWFYFLRICLERATKKDMFVFLYDEAMYPSGSCAGQVVATNPIYAARCIQKRPIGEIGKDEEIILEDKDSIYVHCPSRGTIRGIHWGEDDNEPNAPPAADLLNPEATACFRRLVLDAHYEALAEFFGKCIKGFFTDEPSLLGRAAIPHAIPWTWNFESFLKDFLKYDFVKVLPCLFDSAHPLHSQVTRDFQRAIRKRLESTYYAPYHQWCEEHGVILTGHPAGAHDLHLLKYFHVPGQDIVWRSVEPWKSSTLEGEQSVVAKCSSSAQDNFARKRNLNECFGAYGWEFTFDEMIGLTNWLLIRGVNLLVPHAFYYSLRGNRRAERPPDVGPNSSWWNDYKNYADFCRRVCWILGEGKHVCDVAVLSEPHRLPWRLPKVLFESQRDFNYLDWETLLTEAQVFPEGIKISEMFYKVLLVEDITYWSKKIEAFLTPLIQNHRVILLDESVQFDDDILARQINLQLDPILPPEVKISPPNKNLRYFHVKHTHADFFLFANEGKETIEGEIWVNTKAAHKEWWDPMSGNMVSSAPGHLVLPPNRLIILYCEDGYI